VIWDGSICSALARASCAACGGRGLVGKATDQPCNCVLRSIFRTVHRRFKNINQAGPLDTHNRMDAPSSAMNKPKSFTRRTQTFTADFCNVSKRFLSESEHQIFKFHFLLGADEKLCCSRLKLGDGQLWHSVYRIQQTLGRAFAELQPYPLYPLSDYFGHSHAGGVKPCPVPAARRDNGPLTPPLALPLKHQACPAPALVPVASVANVEPVIIDPKAFARARFADGATTRSIAAALTGQGIPAPNSASRWASRISENCSLPREPPVPKPYPRPRDSSVANKQH
jgi:hypothetical protein